MAEWDAEVVVEPALARRLIEEQFRELRVADVELLGVGWDNTVYAVNGDWAFRFPRRQVAVAGVEREIAALPSIAALVPAPIPVPRFVGRASDAFRWPFFGAPLLRGAAATPVFDDADRLRLAPQLGSFLRRLHDAPAPGGLPHDPVGRADMDRRVPFGAQRLDELARAGLPAPFAALRRVLDEARDLPFSRRATLVHGDLHVRHILVDATLDDPLTGIIDWGDMCLGDPAVDLSIGWSLFSPGARTVFVDAYGPMEPDQVLRARVVALFLSATLARYGHDEGLPALRDESLAALERLVA